MAKFNRYYCLHFVTSSNNREMQKNNKFIKGGNSTNWIRKKKKTKLVNPKIVISLSLILKFITKYLRCEVNHFFSPTQQLLANTENLDFLSRISSRNILYWTFLEEPNCSPSSKKKGSSRSNFPRNQKFNTKRRIQGIIAVARGNITTIQPRKFCLSHGRCGRSL